MSFSIECVNTSKEEKLFSPEAITDVTIKSRTPMPMKDLEG